MIQTRRRGATVALGLEGIVKKVELVDAATGIVERSLSSFKNVITDAGLDGIGNGTTIDSMVNYLAVGTDNTTPAVGQTALGSQLGARYATNGGVADVVTAGPSYAYWELARTRVIPTNDCNGNLTELGFFSAAASGIMWMRQLFLDEMGDPTTITKLNTQQLRVTYAWRVYPSTAISTDVISIGGTSTDCDARALDIDNQYEWGDGGMLKRIGEWTLGASCYETDTFPTTTGGYFTGTAVGASSKTVGSYTNGTFYRDITMVWEPGFANFATGIGAVGFTIKGNGLTCLGTTFSPKVAKDDTQRFTYVARVAWARV